MTESFKLFLNRLLAISGRFFFIPNIRTEFLFADETKNNMVMTEYEFDRICEKQKDCGCKCMQCELFAKYMRNKENDRF